jgi:energy-coupling factor transport system ATP-binding protein
LEIRVNNLDFVYNRGTPLETRALEGISFALEQGKYLGILGGTGSGKTTLIKTLNGLLPPTAGTVLIDGENAKTLGTQLRRRVGVVFQRPERQLFEETVSKDISFVMRRFSDLTDGEIHRRVAEACELVGLDLETTADRPPLALSDGEKRKVAIAGVLVNKPELLILDEPVVGLDPPSRNDLLRVLEAMKESGERSVVIVSHDMDEFLSILDQLMVLENGRLSAFGSPEEVCGVLENNRELLPGFALLLKDLRQAGLPLPTDEYRVSVLADLIEDMSASTGVDH